MGDMGTATEFHAKIADFGDRLQRALADAGGVRKRHGRAIGRARGEERARIARELLPVLDNLDQALEHAGGSADGIIEALRAGRDQAAGIVSGLGFPRQEDQGARFDPARHEVAGIRWGTAAQPGTVVEVLQPAYGDGEHQLRPARVVVAKG
jgi:molecular chaperone GrpE